MYLSGKVHEYALLNYCQWHIHSWKKDKIRFDSIPIVISIIELFCLFSKCVKVPEALKQMEMTLLFIVKTKQEI